jgi:hypothetical protein
MWEFVSQCACRSLEHRRIKIGLQYATKFKSYPLYLDNDCLLTHLYENGYDKQLITIQSFVLWIKSHFENCDIDSDKSKNTLIV